MAPFIEALTFLIQALFNLYMLVVLLRFLLQVARADFYNPISQFVVKATNPPLKPLRRIIPGIAGLDLASLTLALLVQLVAIWATGLLHGQAFVTQPLLVLIWAVLGTTSFLVNIYFFGLIITVISSWIAPNSPNPALMLIHQLLEPVMMPLRRIVPAMGGMDITPIFAFMAISVFRIFLNYFMAMTGLPTFFVLGVM